MQYVEQVQHTLFDYVDDSTLLAVVRKPVDKHAVASSLNRDLAMTGVVQSLVHLNPNKPGRIGSLRFSSLFLYTSLCYFVVIMYLYSQSLRIVLMWDISCGLSPSACRWRQVDSVESFSLTKVSCR